MGIAEGDQAADTDEDVAARLNDLDQFEIPTSALERYIQRADITIDTSIEQTRENLCGALSDEQFSALLRQYRYAGKVTVNYFIITGIDDFDIDDIDTSVLSETPSRDQLEGMMREIFLADTEQMDDRLYISFGYFDTTGGVDPQTGQPDRDFVTHRCVAVIDNDTELVEIRCSDTKMAERARDNIGKALNISRPDNIYRPEFNVGFQKEFGDELVEKYTNLSIRVKEEGSGTVDTMRFTAGTDESGERQDVRKDDRVSRELDEQSAEITMGYVELKDDSRFFINRNGSRISFSRFEQETKINEITEVIDNVLRQTGGYKQHKLSELDIVPE